MAEQGDEFLEEAHIVPIKPSFMTAQSKFKLRRQLYSASVDMMEFVLFAELRELTVEMELKSSGSLAVPGEMVWNFIPKVTELVVLKRLRVKGVSVDVKRMQPVRLLPRIIGAPSFGPLRWACWI